MEPTHTSGVVLPVSGLQLTAEMFPGPRKPSEPQLKCKTSFFNADASATQER